MRIINKESRVLQSEHVPSIKRTLMETFMCGDINCSCVTQMQSRGFGLDITYEQMCYLYHNIPSPPFLRRKDYRETIL
jgi:hypothetical protein